MTSRERILTTLAGEMADRVPVAPFVQEEFLSYCYPEKDSVDRVFDAVTCAGDFGFDLMARPKLYERPDFMRRSYPNWEVSVSETRSGGNLYKTTTITVPGRALKTVAAGPDCGASSSGIHMSMVEYLLKDKEDIEAFLTYLPSVSGSAIDEMRNSVDEWKACVGEAGIVAPWGWGTTFNHASEFRSVESLMVDAYMEQEMYDQLMTGISDAQVQYNSAYARMGLECLGIQGNIANGAMVGHDFFKEFIQPYEQKLIDAVKAEGTHLLYHNCGYAASLYDNYAEMLPTVWETVAAPPQGDSDLAEAKRILGDKIILMGNLDQVRFLKEASVAEVTAKTEEIVQIGKQGGSYIFAASDYLENNTPLENVRAMVQAAIAVGGLGST